MKTAILEFILTCPHCGHPRREVMPTDACQYFYKCENCKTLLRPKAGDFCGWCAVSPNSKRGTTWQHAHAFGA
ncbi:MAG: hypothetical protein EPN62_19700 [Candidimonas sp.]|nr:MAG: hypothetical protein EPN62_19700 [Candidimonas sp.]